jgi:hypothetical protein
MPNHIDMATSKLPAISDVTWAGDEEVFVTEMEIMATSRSE